MNALRMFAFTLLLVTSNGHATENASTMLVESELTTLAGNDAINCGVVALGESRQDAIVCSEHAASAKKAYWVVFQLQGVDSELWEGAARDETGKLWSIFYDSDVTGTGNSSASSLWVASCQAISFSPDALHTVNCKDAVVQH